MYVMFATEGSGDSWMTRRRSDGPLIGCKLGQQHRSIADMRCSMCQAGEGHVYGSSIVEEDEAG